MNLNIPEFSLVLLIGASGSGKSTFARKHFKPTEIVSSDVCRGLVDDNESSLEASADAFDLVHYIAGKRLKRRKLAVIDATNVKSEDRAHLVKVAKAHHALMVAIVLNMPEKVCAERNRGRTDRDFGPHVVRNHIMQLRRGLRNLRREGFHQTYILDAPEDVEAATVTRAKLWTDRTELRGPFDIIGDVHGCGDELRELIAQLGYRANEVEHLVHPEGRTLVFVGDLVDRGPGVVDVLKQLMPSIESGAALCVQGNHEAKLLKWLNGRDVRLTHGLSQSVDQLNAEPEEFRARVRKFSDNLRSHLVLDDWRLVIAHAGLREDMQGRGSAAVRAFALYGDTTGEIDEFGLPVRQNWAAEYRGKPMVVYGHTPVPEAEWLNNTICLDTGCVFGGKLTALRYPERELVSVPARQTYYEPIRPLARTATQLSGQQQEDDILDIADVMGKRVLETKLGHPLTIGADQAAAALEVIGRFAVDPKWLVHLPPTMSPVETSTRPDYLEHPEQAFAFYDAAGVTQVMCEEKHMGSRAVVVLARSVEAAERRFGEKHGARGVIYTRTGRPFFPRDTAMNRHVLTALSEALEASGLWDELASDWIVIDGEVMPWSAKAGALLSTQYGPAGAAASLALGEAKTLLDIAQSRDIDLGALPERVEARARAATAYVDAYSAYCRDTIEIGDLRFAPFHILASEGAVHIDKPHIWHVDQAARLAKAGAPFVQLTRNRVVDLTSSQSREDAAAWWEDLCATGGEGMVVKPMDFIVRSAKGAVIQPALKVRGRNYLRIIYGPEYDLGGNLERLKKRGLSHKRSLALREFALGVEALTRFVAREPLRRVHECVFGIVALETEPVDPRL